MSKKNTPGYVKEIRRNQYSMDGNIQKIFEECEITSYPINVFQIARKLEFDIIYGKFKQENVYGVMWDGNEPLTVGGKQTYRVILLNKEDSLERQAFTVAHEIGIASDFLFSVLGKKHSVYSLVRNSADRKLFFNNRSIGIQFASAVSVFRIAFIAFIVFFDCTVIHLVFSGKIYKIRLDF